MSQMPSSDSKDFPLISIVLLTYCYYEGVFPVLKSLFSQDYPRIEIIISDDGSSNYFENEESIKAYIDAHKKGNIQNIVLMHLPENLGMVKNLNSAIAMANGAYIFSAAPDDYLISPSALREMYTFAVLNNALAINAQTEFYDLESGKVMGTHPSKFLIRVANAMSARQQFNTILRIEPRIVYATSLLISIEVYQNIGLYSDAYKYIEDDPFSLRMTDAGIKIYFMDKSLVRYAASITNTAIGQIYAENSVFAVRKIEQEYCYTQDGPNYSLVKPAVRHRLQRLYSRNDEFALQRKKNPDSLWSKLYCRLLYIDVFAFKKWQWVRLFFYYCKSFFLPNPNRAVR